MRTDMQDYYVTYREIETILVMSGTFIHGDIQKQTQRSKFSET